MKPINYILGLVFDVLGVGALKSIASSISNAGKVATPAPALTAGKITKGSDNKDAKNVVEVIPEKESEISFGGIGNLSDEKAFWPLEAQLTPEELIKLTRFLGSSHFSEDQRRRFRVVAGSGGLVPLKVFVTYNEADMLEICKATGIMNSTEEMVKKAWARISSLEVVAQLKSFDHLVAEKLNALSDFIKLRRKKSVR
jgi:hypothetical protein